MIFISLWKVEKYFKLIWNNNSSELHDMKCRMKREITRDNFLYFQCTNYLPCCSTNSEWFFSISSIVADFFLSPLLEFVGLINQFDTVAVEFAFCCEFWLISEKLAWCSCNSQSNVLYNYQANNNCAFSKSPTVNLLFYFPKITLAIINNYNPSNL